MKCYLVHIFIGVHSGAPWCFLNWNVFSLMMAIRYIEDLSPATLRSQQISCQLKWVYWFLNFEAVYSWNRRVELWFLLMIQHILIWSNTSTSLTLLTPRFPAQQHHQLQNSIWSHFLTVFWYRPVRWDPAEPRNDGTASCDLIHTSSGDFNNAWWLAE